MSQTRDKRRRTDLDLFVLALIGGGVSTPYELMVWARPEGAEDDVTGLEQYARWFARWLVLCLPEDEDLQDAVCCAILIRTQSRAQRFVY